MNSEKVSSALPFSLHTLLLLPKIDTGMFNDQPKLTHTSFLLTHHTFGTLNFLNYFFQQ